MKNENHDIVNDLITRYLAGEASPQEEQELLNWISQSAENEKEYFASKKIFELSNKHYVNRTNSEIDIDIDREWNHFVENIKKEKSAKQISLPTNTAIWYKIAAAILFLLVTGYIVNYFMTKTTSFQYDTADNIQVVTLPDGSKVTLNRHSQIAFTSNFGKDERNITLKGEAFFNIKRDTLKPFKIAANQAVIEVLGTSFNVRAYERLKDVEVVVETGVVKLSIPETKTDVKLIAGQKGIFTKEDKKISSATNEDVNFQSWNTQKIVFIETDLRSVVETINRIYQSHIIISTDVAPSCEVTVSFDHQTLESVLHVLERTLNLTFVKKGDQIEITHAGC